MDKVAPFYKKFCGTQKYIFIFVFYEERGEKQAN